MSRKSPIVVEIEDARWKKVVRGLSARIGKIIDATLSQEKAKGFLTILLSDDAKLKELNSRFRGKSKPTNVLSFPSEEDGYLGDIAIAYGVTAREAKAAGKMLADHTLHLAVHGALHLLGHNHENPREANRMERLEREILAEFGIADPYAMNAPKRRARSKKRYARS
ncbi:MAG TPA: rRNA maturation RNase YbeY [Rhizomicrobium sp.]|jgi:probable rRNA maturation factor|nr:rRNA maturation RNase YbeY [Rhizomicrobium sp.]